MNRKSNRFLSPSLWVGYHYAPVYHMAQVDLNGPMIESFVTSSSNSRRRSHCRSSAYSFDVRQRQHVADGGMSPVRVGGSTISCQTAPRTSGIPVSRAAKAPAPNIATIRTTTNTDTTSDVPDILRTCAYLMPLSPGGKILPGPSPFVCGPVHEERNADHGEKSRELVGSHCRLRHLRCYHLRRVRILAQAHAVDQSDCRRCHRRGGACGTDHIVGDEEREGGASIHRPQSTE